jgi:phage host-nuclease inhibitor protein Gam
MSKQRTKVSLPNLNREQAEAVFAEYATASAKINKINASLNLQMVKIREKYQDELAQLETIMEESTAKLQNFATLNREEYFAKKKSLEMSHGKIGFRTDPPSLAPMKGFTWESIKNLVKAFKPSYIRTKEEVDKESLLAERDNHIEPVNENDPIGKLPEEERPLISSLFSQMGIRVKQDDHFFVEPKTEEVTA